MVNLCQVMAVIRSVLLLAVLCSSGVIAAQPASQAIDPTGPWGSPHKVHGNDSKVRQRMPTLQAIFVRGQQYIAVMDDKEVVAGSSVAGYKVRRITAKFVYFTAQGKEFRLALFASNIKH